MKKPMCLLTMAVFLVSARPLPPILRGRLLVYSISSFSSSWTTVLLINSLPQDHTKHLEGRARRAQEFRSSERSVASTTSHYMMTSSTASVW